MTSQNNLVGCRKFISHAMATKRKPTTSNSSKFNFRPSQEKIEQKGTKPTADKFSVQNVLLMMIQHFCRKLLFIDIRLRVFTYLGFIFFFSVLVDVLPLPRAIQNSLSVSKDNFFNAYFVKVGWGWTLLLGIPFCALTSFIYSCGRRNQVIKNITRFAVATFFWYFWTNLVFSYVEVIFGKCNVKDSKLQQKTICLRKGFYWQGVDISGHCFILLYSTLLLIEECRVIICWEGIADIIRDEDYSRTVEGASKISSQLRSLSDDEFLKLKAAYPKLTPFIRTLFILITLLIILWDAMLITTVIFYHNMVEKVIAALTAVATWYLTYYVWFPSSKILPPSPGDGLFKYRTEAKQQSLPLKKKGSMTNNKVPGPRFMGMPIKVPEESKNTTQNEMNS